MNMFQGVATGPFVNVGRQELIETPLVSSYALPENKKEYKVRIRVLIPSREAFADREYFGLG